MNKQSKYFRFAQIALFLFFMTGVIDVTTNNNVLSFISILSGFISLTLVIYHYKIKNEELEKRVKELENQEKYTLGHIETIYNIAFPIFEEWSKTKIKEQFYIVNDMEDENIKKDITATPTISERIIKEYLRDDDD